MVSRQASLNRISPRMYDGAIQITVTIESLSRVAIFEDKDILVFRRRRRL